MILHKISRLPPPSALLNLFNDKNKNSKDDLEDTPDQHNGRIRSFAHERGNWASYVFVAVGEYLNPQLSSCANLF